MERSSDSAEDINSEDSKFPVVASVRQFPDFACFCQVSPVCSDSAGDYRQSLADSAHLETVLHSVAQNYDIHGAKPNRTD